MQHEQHILYVEDDAEDREIFQEAVAALKAPVFCYCASDGEKALDLLLHKMMVMPDYIFLDVNMPVMNGWEFLKTIKQIPTLRTIPVIIYSTTTHPNEHRKFLETGAVEVIVKPSTFTGVKSLIGKILLIDKFKIPAS